MTRATKTLSFLKTVDQGDLITWTGPCPVVVYPMSEDEDQTTLAGYRVLKGPQGTNLHSLTIGSYQPFIVNPGDTFMALGVKARASNPSLHDAIDMHILCGTKTGRITLTDHYDEERDVYPDRATHVPYQWQRLFFRITKSNKS